jgi:hypothetical protein
MRLEGYEFKTKILKDAFTEGKAKGEAEGEARGLALALLKVLQGRKIEVDEPLRKEVLACGTRLASSPGSARQPPPSRSPTSSSRSGARAHLRDELLACRDEARLIGWIDKAIAAKKLADVFD